MEKNRAGMEIMSEVRSGSSKLGGGAAHFELKVGKKKWELESGSELGTACSKASGEKAGSLWTV